MHRDHRDMGLVMGLVFARSTPCRSSSALSARPHVSRIYLRRIRIETERDVLVARKRLFCEQVGRDQSSSFTVMNRRVVRPLEVQPPKAVT